MYCLLREQWGQVRALFDIEHFQPVVQRPDLAIDYDNLLYACATCNAAKRAHEVPDPLRVLTSATVRVAEDGRLQAGTLVHVLSGYTEDFDALEVDFEEPINAHYVQIRTTFSPSWVAWTEVQI